MDIADSAELWKPIKDNPKYWISTWGRVKNVKFNRILKPQRATNGYLQVGISNNSHSTSKSIHQLMALTFLGSKPFKFEISHIDNEKENNRLSNLEYVYYKENRRKRSIYKFCDVCKELLSPRKGSKDTKTCSPLCHRKKYGKSLKLICKFCGKHFLRKASDHRRSTKYNPGKGQNTFCSKRCFGSWAGKNFGWQTEYQKKSFIS